MLTLEVRVIAPLPDEAVTSVSEAVVVEVVEDEEEEELSFLEQPRKIKLITPNKMSKFVEFFIITSLNNKSQQPKNTEPAGLDQPLLFLHTELKLILFL
jgi:hypothetical protein